MMAETPETQTISSRMSIPEIARRLNIGRQSVYAMLEQGLLPGIRVGRRLLVTRHAFESWERTCGMRDTKGRELKGVFAGVAAAPCYGLPYKNAGRPVSCGNGRGQPNRHRWS